MKARGSWVSNSKNNPFLRWRTFECVICSKLVKLFTTFNRTTCSEDCGEELRKRLVRKNGKERTNDPVDRVRRRHLGKIKKELEKK